MADTSLVFRLFGRDVNLGAALRGAGNDADGLSAKLGNIGSGVLGGTSRAAAGIGLLGTVGAGVFGGLAAGMAGVGIGIAGIGIAAAAQSQQVKSAFSDLKADFKSTITEAAAPLIPVLTNVATQARTLIGPLGESLGTAFTAMAPAIKSFTGSLVSGLQPVIGAIGPIATAVSPLISALGAGLEPVLGALAGTLTMVAQTAGQFAPQLQQMFVAVGQLVTALGPLLSGLIQLGAPIIGPLLGLVAGLAGQISAVLSPILAQLGPILGQVVTALMPLVGAVGALLAAVLPLLVPIGQLIGQLVGGLVPVLVPIIELVAQVAGQIVALLVPALEFIVPILVTVIGWIGQLVEVILSVLSGAISWLVENVPKAWERVKVGIGVAVNAVKGIIAWFGNLPGMIGGWFGRMRDAAVNRVTALVTFIRGLPGKIVSALGNIGSLLVQKGRDVVSGLWRGIQSMGAWLRNTLIGWARNLIPGPIAKALGIASPSKLMASAVGRWIPPGIVQGAEAAAPEMNRRLSNLVQPTRPTTSPYGVTGAANSAGGGAGGETRIVFDGRGIDGELLKMLRKMVRVEGRGSVQAAFGKV